MKKNESCIIQLNTRYLDTIKRFAEAGNCTISDVVSDLLNDYIGTSIVHDFVKFSPYGCTSQLNQRKEGESTEDYELRLYTAEKIRKQD